MQASEYIAELQALVDTHGDLECVDAENEPIGSPEWSGGTEDAGEDAFVLADKA